jgi:anti-anti-sigma factor
MSVAVDETTSPPVLRLEGSIGQGAAEHLHELALRLLARGDDVIVDCEQARHLGGAALQILLALRHGLRRGGRRLTLRGASPAVARDVAWVGLRQD